MSRRPLFTRGIGEVTDIVEKEMYSFEDSMNGEKLTLRPENTSAVVRCAIEHSLTYNAPQRLWYFGPMFRTSARSAAATGSSISSGCEALGFAGPDIDVELLAMDRRVSGKSSELKRASSSIPWANSKSAPSTARRSLRTFSKTPIFWTKTQRDGFSQTP